MAGEEGAGRSAEEWSRRLRQQAAHLEARAERIEQGARGERRTAEVLNPRSGDGWYVLHDVAVPDSRANIDHVVVTPAGVVVVDSKDWTGRLSAGRDTFWVGRYPKSRELEILLWETSVVAGALEAAVPDLAVPVRAVISLTGTTPAEPELTARGVTAVAVGDLIAHLGAARPVLDPAQVETVAQAIDRRLRSRTGAASSIVHPDPLPPIGNPIPASLDQVRRTNTAIPGPAIARRPAPYRSPQSFSAYRQGRPPRSRPGRAAPNPAALRKTATVIGIGFVGLMALGAVGSALKHLDPTTSTIPIPAPSAGASAPTQTPVTPPSTAAPAVVQATWTCPAPGRGWTATLAWPAGESPNSYTVAQIAPSAAGPWTQATSSRGPTPIQVTGIAANTTEWVRAGDLITIEISGRPVMQGPIAAPSGC